MPAQGRYLGIDEEPITDASGLRGMKVTNVYSGTAAERAGLQVGDMIYSINGYLTEQRGNLAWIIGNAAPNDQLRMSVKTTKDGREHTITAQLP
jgi:serine protease Do